MTNSFSVICEGLSDFPVIENLLVGFFNDKDLSVNKLYPKDEQPTGWGNVLSFISNEEFRKAFWNESIYVVVQIDTDKCEDWKEGLRNIGDDSHQITEFVEKVKTVLINKIGKDFYSEHQSNIIFAITVHEIECWLLPFHYGTAAHYSKIVGCYGALKSRVKKTLGIDINQKNYGKNYDTLARPMRKELFTKAPLNPSLYYFVNSLKEKFPAI